MKKNRGSKKLKKEPIKFLDAFKLANNLAFFSKENSRMRRTLLKFLRQNLEEIKEICGYAYKKLIRGYGSDLKDIEISDATRKLINKKKAKNVACKECIVVPNCSKICSNFTENFNNLEKESLLNWGGKKK